MTDDIDELLVQMRELQGRLQQRFREAEREFRFSLEDGRVRFTREAQRVQRRYRVGLLAYLRAARPLSLLTAPVIYSMIVPLVFLDVSVSLYQHICFRAYGIDRVRRRDYLVIDRYLLAYLNPLERLNCVYCGYGNGLIAFVREVVARTERYWCPIRHSRSVRGAHDYYPEFFDYGDAAAYRERREDVRRRLADDPDAS